MTSPRTASPQAPARTTGWPFRALVLALLVGTLALAGCTPGSGVSTVAPKAWLAAAAEPGVVIIDVRTPEEYAAGHLDKAINLDVQAADFATRMGQLDPSGTYAVYCHSGRRSGMATTAMGKAGFTKVYNLQGGITDLQAAGAVVVAG